VRDDEKIASFRLITIATIQRKNIAANRIKEPLNTMLGVSRGVMLQGVTFDCDPFKVASIIPGLKKPGELPRGEAYLIADDDSAHIVLPRVEIPADESEDD